MTKRIKRADKYTFSYAGGIVDVYDDRKRQVTVIAAQGDQTIDSAVEAWCAKKGLQNVTRDF